MEEDYVSFELAKMLKEKGFDEPTMSFFRGDKIIWQQAFYPTDIKRPTLQMAQKWFREEKHLAINPSTFYRKLEGHEFHNWGCNIVNLDTWELYCSNPLETFPADTYEEALEKAMKYALEKFV